MLIGHAMAISFFRIEERSVIPGGWGDYGRILQHGMTAHARRIGGRLALERTGPYIPPITLSLFDIVLTDEAKTLLESSGLTGFSFLPVEKKLIVELPWETWDLSAEEPPEYPESGEPEDYILGKPHSPSAAAALGELWEVVVPFTVEILRPAPIVSSYKELTIKLSTWDGSDLIRGREFGSILFSERARDWFSERWGEYVRFDSFPAA
ncbi:MAG TPA: hypothetical protein VGD59_15295 [Acidisarcina sp.]